MIYLQIALIIAGIGIFQEFSYLIGFTSGYDYSSVIPKWHVADTDWGVLKVNSILLEPSHFAISMAPAFLVSLFNIFRKNAFNQRKLASIVIVVSFILTFSAVAYIAILISILLISYSANKFRHTLLAMIVVFMLAFSAYSYIPEMRTRVDDTFGIAAGSMETTEANLSTFSLVSNAFVAYNSFLDSPLFGHGLGSHPISYDKYVFGVIGGDIQEDVFGINKDDASSLFLRLISETGLFGIVAVLYFVLKCNLINCPNNNMQIISNSILCLLLICLLRQGHYFYNGLFFFVWMYYFSYKLYMEYIPDP
jgi:O-antigen ligase